MSSEPVPEEFEEFTDEEEWIDELEDDDETETYYTEEGDQETSDPFYNLWIDYITDKNPATYVALTAEVHTETPTLNTNTALTNSQKEKAGEMLTQYHHLFMKNISEERQTLELE